MQRRISLSVLPLGAAALHVGEGRWLAAHPADGNDVQGPVELPVAEPVEAVPVGPAREWGGDDHSLVLPQLSSIRLII